MPKEIKLNLGCGPTGLDGWLNYDWGVLPFLSYLPFLRRLLIKLGILPQEYDQRWSKIKLVDIRKKLPLKNDIVKYIYCAEVLEHFEYWEVLKTLKECRRVLTKGGCIRITVPDLEKMYTIYKRSLSHKTTHPSISRPGRELCVAWWGYEKDRKPRNLIERGVRYFIRDHKWHYDYYELKLLLRKAGFEQIRLCEFRKGLVPDLEKLDLECHQATGLYMEAIKTR